MVTRAQIFDKGCADMSTPTQSEVTGVVHHIIQRYSNFPVSDSKKLGVGGLFLDDITIDQIRIRLNAYLDDNDGSHIAKGTINGSTKVGDVVKLVLENLSKS